MNEMIRLSSVAKGFGHVDAVRNVSFSLRAGETAALVGHNGAGKTTLIKMMLGLLRPSAGTVSVLGVEAGSGDATIRRHLGYLPESVAFHGALTGRETLAFYARLKGIEPDAAQALFGRVGLAAGAVDRPVRTYSKGMRQRLGLAQALLGAPRILLLDEPTSGLDPASRRQFYELIGELRATGTAVLLSSHALDELEGRTDRVIIVSRGLKIADGSLDDLRRLARLPTRLSVRLKQPEASIRWGGDDVGWRHVDAMTVEAEVAPELKLAALAGVMADSSGLADVTVSDPTLDDLYAHFLVAEGAR